MDTGWGPPTPSPRPPEELEAEKQRRTMFAVIALAVFLFFSIPLQLLCISLCWKRRRKRRIAAVAELEEGGEERPPEMTERTRPYTPSVSTATSDASSDTDDHSLQGSQAEGAVAFSGSVLPRSAVHRIPAPTKSKQKGSGKNAKPIGPAEALGIDRDTYFREGMPPRSSSSEDIIAAPAKIHVPFEHVRNGPTAVGHDYSASSSDGNNVSGPRIESHTPHEVTGINPWDCEHLPNAVIFPHLRESEMEVGSEARTNDALAVQAPGYSRDMSQSPSIDMPPSPGYATDVMRQSPTYGTNDMSPSQSPASSSNLSPQSPYSVTTTPQSLTYSAGATAQSPTYDTQTPSSPGSSSNGKEPSRPIRDNSPYSQTSSVPTSQMSQEDALETIHERGEFSNLCTPTEVPPAMYHNFMTFPSPSNEEIQHNDDQSLELIREPSGESTTSPSGDELNRERSANSAASPSGDSDTQNKIHQCQHCTLAFDTIGRLNTHINRKHRRRYNCSFCNKAFALKTDLERHLRTVHRRRQHSSQVYRCTIPGCTIPLKDFVRKDNFERHVVRCRLRHLEQEGEGGGGASGGAG